MLAYDDGLTTGHVSIPTSAAHDEKMSIESLPTSSGKNASVYVCMCMDFILQVTKLLIYFIYTSVRVFYSVL